MNEIDQRLSTYCLNNETSATSSTSTSTTSSSSNSSGSSSSSRNSRGRNNGNKNKDVAELTLFQERFSRPPSNSKKDEWVRYINKCFFKNQYSGILVPKDDVIWKALGIECSWEEQEVDEEEQMKGEAPGEEEQEDTSCGAVSFGFLGADDSRNRNGHWNNTGNNNRKRPRVDDDSTQNGENRNKKGSDWRFKSSSFGERRMAPDMNSIISNRMRRGEESHSSLHLNPVYRPSDETRATSAAAHSSSSIAGLSDHLRLYDVLRRTLAATSTGTHTHTHNLHESTRMRTNPLSSMRNNVHSSNLNNTSGLFPPNRSMNSREALLHQLATSTTSRPQHQHQGILPTGGLGSVNILSAQASALASASALLQGVSASSTQQPSNLSSVTNNRIHPRMINGDGHTSFSSSLELPGLHYGSNASSLGPLSPAAPLLNHNHNTLMSSLQRTRHQLSLTNNLPPSYANIIQQGNINIDSISSNPLLQQGQGGGTTITTARQQEPSEPKQYPSRLAALYAHKVKIKPEQNGHFLSRTSFSGTDGAEAGAATSAATPPFQSEKELMSNSIFEQYVLNELRLMGFNNEREVMLALKEVQERSFFAQSDSSSLARLVQETMIQIMVRADARFFSKFMYLKIIKTRLTIIIFSLT